MKNKYRTHRREGIYYIEDTETGQQTSLRTRDSKEAETLKDAHNAAARDAALAVAIGAAYFSNRDPEVKTRTWRTVFDEFVRRGKKQSTRDRRTRALRSPDFDPIRNKRIVETTSSDFDAVLKDRKASVIHNLRVIHNLARGFGHLPFDIIP